MLKIVNLKHRFMLGAINKALSAALITSLLSCGGNSDKTDVVSQTNPEQTLNPTLITPNTASAPDPVPTTAAALEKFWGLYGAKETFTPMYVELITKLLEAEDKVFSKDYKAARTIVDALIAKYPLMDNTESSRDIWSRNYYSARNKKPMPHLGEPGAYAHLRMLDDITNFGTKNSLPGTTPIQMAIVMPVCSDIVLLSGATFKNERLSPEIEADDYKVVRQSLRLFQSYMLAISKGELRLELNFYKINSCIQINKRIFNAQTPITQLPPGVIEKSDMFWMIYPTDYDKNMEELGGGMGSFDQKPLFIIDDDWLFKKKKGDEQGGGVRTEVERRMYIPEWVQHEFFHHLYSSWPEFKLEGAKNHEWFDRNYWPADFIGLSEEDYYSESLRKRLYNATPSIAQKLQRAAK